VDVIISANTRILTVEFEYLEPETISEAIDLLTKYGGEAKLIAGGTDLLVDMKNGKIRPRYLISILRIPDLNYIIEEADGLRIGAGTFFQEIVDSQLVRDKYQLIHDAAMSLGTAQIRNMATIGGNICNALPSADMPPALVALDARVKIAGKDGERTLPLEELFVGVRKTKLRGDELLTEIVVKRPPERSGTAFIKLAKTSEDLATLNVAVRVTVAKDGACEGARIVVGGGIGPTLIRSRKAEKILEGKVPNETTIKEVAEAACEGFQCRPTSIRASPYYKTEVSKVLVKRALLKALENVKEGAEG